MGCDLGQYRCDDKPPDWPTPRPKAVSAPDLAQSLHLKRMCNVHRLHFTGEPPFPSSRNAAYRGAGGRGQGEVWVTRGQSPLTRRLSYNIPNGFICCSCMRRGCWSVRLPTPWILQSVFTDRYSHFHCDMSLCNRFYPWNPATQQIVSV